MPHLTPLSGAPATLDRWLDFPAESAVDDVWWQRCVRGDHMLWVAEHRNVSVGVLASCVQAIVELADSLHMALLERVRKGRVSMSYDPATYTSFGEQSMHALAHRYHGMADCLHAKASAYHWLSHHGGGYPALCAMHYHDAMLLADFRLGREKALAFAQQQTAAIVRGFLPTLPPM